MKTTNLRLNKPLRFILLLLLPGVSATAATRVISPDFGGRYLPISEVSFTVAGSPVTQTTEVVNNSTNTQPQPVFVESVEAGTRTLDIFNFAGARLRDANGVYDQSSIMTTESGIRVMDSSGEINVSDGKAAFDTALAQSTQNSDILNYIAYDGDNTEPAAAFDFDLLFRRAFEPSDGFLIQERDGNTYFKMDPLDADGNVIAGANTLVFGGNTDEIPEETGNSLERYDWNTGYALENYQSDQPIVFTAVLSEQFFVGTDVDAEDQDVYGFRIDNNGNADVKFFGISDDPFDDNPINPLVPVPEPASAALILAAAAGLAGGLRRRRS